MACKSLIGTANTVSVAGLPNGSTLPLGSISRRRGCQLGLIGNDILVKGEGYCDVKALATFVPNGTGVFTVYLYQDGVAVPGAVGSATIASGNTATIPVNSIIATDNRTLGSRLSLVVTSNPTTATVTMNNLAVQVEKI